MPTLSDIWRTQKWALIGVACLALSAALRSEWPIAPGVAVVIYGVIGAVTGQIIFVGIGRFIPEGPPLKVASLFAIGLGVWLIMQEWPAAFP